ncbi:hypothetical protein [Brevundimonas sp.]
MSALKPLTRSVLIVAATAALAACATAPVGGGYGGSMSSTFSAADFAWSERSGPASIDGRVDYRRDGQAFACTGSVVLTPATPYTRHRFQTLYGSTDRAALPASVVRSRNVPDPNADYRAYVRQATCANNRFAYDGLPDGQWFVIATVSAGGDPIVLMQRVETRGGRRVPVTL